MANKLSYIVRYSIYLLLIFTSLSRGAVLDWALAGIHIITLIVLAAFLMESWLKWNWLRIRTPLYLRHRPYNYSSYPTDGGRSFSERFQKNEIPQPSCQGYYARCDDRSSSYSGSQYKRF